MTIQWVSSFEMLLTSTAQTPGSFSNINVDRMFWNNISDTPNVSGFRSSQYSGINSETPNPGNEAGGVVIYTRQSSGQGDRNIFSVIGRSVQDTTKLVAAGGFRIGSLPQIKTTAILSLAGANKVSFGVNGKLAALYVDDILASTSVIDVLTGMPWFFVELFQNKTTGKVFLKINGQAACDADLPIGHVTDQVILDLGRQPAQENGVSVSEVIVYSDEDPMGPLHSHSYFKTGQAITSQFVGNDNIVNNRPFTDAQFKNSETLGAEDRFNYTNIMPVGVEATEIKAVIHEVVAASGGVTGGSLNLRTRIGSNDYDTSVSDKLTSTTPVLVQSVMEVSPATGVAWTRSEVQGIQTGYVVAP